MFDERSLKCDWQWKVGSCGEFKRNFTFFSMHDYDVIVFYLRKIWNIVREQ